MAGQPFPLKSYLSALNRFLDTIDYNDTNYTRPERVHHNKHVYIETARHFAQPGIQKTLGVSVKHLETMIRTIVLTATNGWPKSLLDDSTDGDPHAQMASFYEDLVQGRTQRHPWWRLLNEQMPIVLQHYGSFCQLNLIRSTTDFFTGCWVEQHSFQGYPGSNEYPLFLRRLNGLGHSVGALLFPSALFDERTLFKEIATATAQVDPVAYFVNDLCSFYKEWEEPRDQTNLVKNWCAVDGIDMDSALARLADETIRCVERLLGVFEGKNAAVRDTLAAFANGYVTWHFCDHRYRLDEVYELAEGLGEEGEKFRRYFETARDAGFVPLENWAIPRLADVMEEVRREGEGVVEVETTSTSVSGGLVESVA
ncbi:uncharacterized protein K452DRAFT_322438 [Aplosporella prunicola CBS 121167]|uniref:Trichodiene synthase n=1 Tax=Aplosporella prunicola CBS 121167 TaxID=1176127 RepID=A0A6A6AZR0_9PEZI|nr:uncharacterized protein K452DRAFT_322438 [Aplosporella prunicola CBS 121167]KAF2136445.1 hypothetical protein K452DRAFT_322438 [Aplosporella prunicola CBS 121167]